jgi:integrase
MGKHKVKPNYRRRLLRLPDLDHCKRAVLNGLGSPASRRVYEYAIDQFIAWYCSEPRLAFNRIVVVRYRMYLESRGLAANTINQQLAAVRRLAHEAADAGLLSPELAAGISRVKGVKQLGFRAGNWLSAAQSSEVLLRASGEGMRARRDYAMLAMLFGCGFRRSELVGLELGEIQIRQGHWAVVDLIGKGGHVRTVPIPEWVKAALDQWTRAAGVREFSMIRHWAKHFAGWVGYSVLNGLLMVSTGHLVNNPSVLVPRWWSISATVLMFTSALVSIRFVKNYTLNAVDKAALMTWLLAFTFAVVVESTHAFYHEPLGLGAMFVGTLALVAALLYRRATHHHRVSMRPLGRSV